MKDEYKGWDIKYDEDKEVFIAEKGNRTHTSSSLKKLKKRLTTEDKRKVTRVPCLVVEGYGHTNVYVTGNVTSMSTMRSYFGSRENQFNVSSKRNTKSLGKDIYDRLRLKPSEIFKPTDRNLKAFAKILELDKTVKAGEGKIRKLKDALESFGADELKKAMGYTKEELKE